jgi:RNA polymerase sigma factor (sigma-70 family)
MENTQIWRQELGRSRFSPRNRRKISENVLEGHFDRGCNGAATARARRKGLARIVMADFDVPANQSAAGHSSFDTTHWSAVLNAKASDSGLAGEALARLCQSYWYPLYAFVRRQGYSPEDAQDLVQGFFARLLEKKYVQSADPDKGKFRSFLLIALKRYMVNEWVREHREKRGGHQDLLSLDQKQVEARFLAEPATQMTPEKAYDRRWALAVLEQVLQRLGAEFAATGQAQIFAELEGFLNGEENQRSYAEIGKRLGMSPGTLRGTMYRLRQRLREILRLEIARTLSGPEGIDQEIRYLYAALRES